MTAEQRAGLSDAALAMTQPCIDELIKDISRRVQKAGAITDTAEYQLYRAQALGESKKAIEQAVSKQIGISEEVIASLFEYVADKSLSLDENGSLKRMTEAYTRMTQSKTRELLGGPADPGRHVYRQQLAGDAGCRQPTPAQWILLSGRLPQVHWT